MNKKSAPRDNSANMPNANRGTPGTNRQYDQAQGNRGKQLAETPDATPAVKPKDATKGGGKVG
jgi:hypothetical protein